MAISRELIKGVVQKRLNVNVDERGRLMEMIRADDRELGNIKFGQVYMTTAQPGVVKAWHFHKKQTDHFVCVHGQMKVVLYDAREGSPTNGIINEFVIGDHAPFLIEIPHLVYHGFKCISTVEAIVINYTTEIYNYKDPDEFRIPPHGGEIPYDWSRKDG
jgi:dTDP-4-dehydrorhamnose 3,5-epimerase